MLLDWTIVTPAFLAAVVEWVEAFTIVLAASLSIGWRSAAGAALAAFAALAAMTAASSQVLALGPEVPWLQGLVGVFLLLFGMRWLAKAVARGAGRKPLHDEADEFVATRMRLVRGDRAAGWMIAFKGVLLEGLEVWLIVAAFGLQKHAWISGAAGALAALVLVVAVGLLVQAPLRHVPENAIKFAVGAMITAFGSFWTLEAVAGAAAWPAGDLSLAALAVFYALGGMILIAALLRPGGRASR